MSHQNLKALDRDCKTVKTKRKKEALLFLSEDYYKLLPKLKPSLMEEKNCSQLTHIKHI